MADKIISFEDDRVAWADKMLNFGRMKFFARELAFAFPNTVLLVAALLKDERVPARAKAVIAGTAAYLASPIDIIPDFIPVLGYLDDFIVILIILDGLLNYVDRKIIAQHWRGDSATLEFLQKLSRAAAFFIPGRIKRRIFGKEA